MKVEFWLRIPGRHEKMTEAEMDCVPRTGEEVYNPDGQKVHEVHSVGWDLVNKRAIVLLKV